MVLFRKLNHKIIWHQYAGASKEWLDQNFPKLRAAPEVLQRNACTKIFLSHEQVLSWLFLSSSFHRAVRIYFHWLKCHATINEDNCFGHDNWLVASYTEKQKIGCCSDDGPKMFEGRFSSESNKISSCRIWTLPDHVLRFYFVNNLLWVSLRLLVSQHGTFSAHYFFCRSPCT